MNILRAGLVLIAGCGRPHPGKHVRAALCKHVRAALCKHVHAALCKHVRAAQTAGLGSTISWQLAEPRSSTPLSSGMASVFCAGGKTFQGRTALDTLCQLPGEFVPCFT